MYAAKMRQTGNVEVVASSQLNFVLMILPFISTDIGNSYINYFKNINRYESIEVFFCIFAVWYHT